MDMAKLPTISKNHCSAINCSNDRFKRKSLSFFRFPKDPTRCEKWVQNSWRTDLMSKGVAYLRRSCVLCSDHFEMSQFMNKNKNRLIWKAVPTIFKIPSPLPSVLGKSSSPKTKQCKSPGPKEQVLSSGSFSCKTAIKSEPGVEVDQNCSYTYPASDFLTVEIKTIKAENEDSPSSSFDYYDRKPIEIELNDRDKGSAPNQDALQQQAAMQPPMIDQITLLQNEDESFVLAPLEQTVTHGPERTVKAKRRRKLIVDKVINVSAEEIKSQLSDTTDIVTMWDLAPRPKLLTPWKESGGVEKLFALPGHNIGSKHISKFFHSHLTTNCVENQRMVLNEDAENDEEQPALKVNEEQELLGESENQRNYSMQDQVTPDVTGQFDSTLKRRIEEDISGMPPAQKTRIGLDDGGIPQIPSVNNEPRAPSFIQPPQQQFLDSQQHFMPPSLHNSSKIFPQQPSMQSSVFQPDILNPPLQPSNTIPPPQPLPVLNIFQLQQQPPLIGNGIEPKCAHVDPAPDCQCLQTETIKVDNEDSSSSVSTYNDGRPQGIEQGHMDEGSLSCKTAIKTEPGVEVDQNCTYTIPASDFITVDMKTIKEENEISPNCTFDYLDRTTEGIERSDRDKEYNQETCKNIMDLAFSKRIDKFICDVDVNYYETKEMVEETQMTKPTPQKSFECNICHKCFSFKANLKSHMIIHTNEKPFECTVCHKCFTQNSSLKDHIRIHTKEKPFECTFCHKCFYQNSNLKAHMRIHTKEKPFECTFCHKCFSQSSHLKDHMRIHTKELPFECSFCHKCFTQSSSLKTHMHVHTKEMPFECTFCHKSFSQSINFKVHMRIHTKEKPFECSFCHKCFNQNGNLKTHMRVHTKERPFECDVCHKYFFTTSSLKAHMRIHTNEKPFECTYCHKFFNQTSHLRTHMRLHTDLQSFG